MTKTGSPARKNFSVRNGEVMANGNKCMFRGKIEGGADVSVRSLGELVEVFVLGQLDEIGVKEATVDIAIEIRRK